MRYLRMLTNAVVGGLLGAAFMTLVVLQLNPQITLQPQTIAHLASRIALLYGVGLAVLFYALIVLRTMIARDVLSPGWLSLRLLAWLSTLVAGGAAALMWLNLSSYALVLDADTARRMSAGAAATSVSAVLLFIIAVVHYSFGRRGSAVGGTLYTLTVAASLMLPLISRGSGHPRVAIWPEPELASVVAPRPSSGRVFFVALDGGSLDYITTAAAEGRLPNFGKILDQGAAMHLRTVRPTQPSPVWATVATGKYPPKHGIRSAATYSYADGFEPIELLPDLSFAHALVQWGFLDELPLRSDGLRARQIWQTLSRLGISVGVVAWPLTSPPRPVLGYLVTDLYHLSTASPFRFIDEELAYPAEALKVAKRYSTVTSDEETGVQATTSAGTAVGFDAVPYLRDRTYLDIAGALEQRYAPRFVSMRYVGLDVVGHHFLRFANPTPFGDVTDDERRRFGNVLNDHYNFIDAEIGALMGRLLPDDLLLVVSGFGMDPVGPGKRLLARALGDPDLTGTHEHAPNGFLLAYGLSVNRGRLPLGTLVDVAPTVLYFLGLPIARDMDGYARTEIFTGRFTGEHPITFIPSYDR